MARPSSVRKEKGSGGLGLMGPEPRGDSRWWEPALPLLAASSRQDDRVWNWSSTSDRSRWISNASSAELRSATATHRVSDRDQVLVCTFLSTESPNVINQLRTLKLVVKYAVFNTIFHLCKLIIHSQKWVKGKYLFWRDWGQEKSDYLHHGCLLSIYRGLKYILLFT